MSERQRVECFRASGDKTKTLGKYVFSVISESFSSSSAVFRLAGTGESLTDLPSPFKPSSIRATASIYGRGRRTTTTTRRREEEDWERALSTCVPPYPLAKKSTAGFLLLKK